MTQNIEDFCAQWRSSAHENVSYTTDFPECFLVLPELIDGAIGQGNATKVIIEIKFNEDNTGYLKVSDNGVGVKNPTRLLSWASKNSASVHHRYGHGSKKCLTKWNKDYNAKWYIKYRHKRTKGIDSLFQYNSPFKGINTECIQDDDNEVDLMPSGLEWYIEFNREILNNKNNIKDTFDSIKEILRTRYLRKYFDKTEFIVKVFDNKEVLEESSKVNKWTTFDEALIEEINNKNCIELYNKDINFNPNTKCTYRVYYVTLNGLKAFNLKKEFLTYGQKNMNCSRIYISLHERVIEIAPFWKFMKDRDSNHNSLNGIFAFVNFESLNLETNKDDKDNKDHKYIDNLPTPCTTKVSFYEHCDNFIKLKEILYEINPQIIKDKDKPQPKPESESEIESNSEIESESETEDEDEKTKTKTKTKTKPKAKSISKPPKRNISKNLKDLVWESYIGDDIIKHKCLCCKIRLIKNTDFHCGHIIPESKGGKETIENLRPICSKCNLGMGSQHMIEYIKQHEFYIGK
jgi:5-methylcytosine-specific restriction endonuclease McrA